MSTILNIFTPLYKWCSKLGERLLANDDFHDYYQSYFQETAVCTNVFLVALITALALACVYYFVFCNISFSAAKRSIWAMVACLSFVITMFVTPSFIVGHYDEAGLYDGMTHTRLFDNAKKTLEGKIFLADSDDELTEAIDTAEDYAQNFRIVGSNKPAAIGMFSMAEHIPLHMSLMNGVYSLIIFFLLSVFFKRFTIHGKAIPF